MADYVITQTSSTVYLDRRNMAVNGYLIYVDLLEFNEVHDLRVPSLDETTVKAAVEQLLKQRRALAKLGQTLSK